MRSEKTFAFLTNAVVSRLPAAPIRNCRRSNMIYGSPRVHAHRESRPTVAQCPREGKWATSIAPPLPIEAGWRSPTHRARSGCRKDTSAKGGLAQGAASNATREGRRLARGSNTFGRPHEGRRGTRRAPNRKRGPAIRPSRRAQNGQGPFPAQGLGAVRFAVRRERRGS